MLVTLYNFCSYRKINYGSVHLIQCDISSNVGSVMEQCRRIDGEVVASLFTITIDRVESYPRTARQESHVEARVAYVVLAVYAVAVGLSGSSAVAIICVSGVLDKHIQVLGYIVHDSACGTSWVIA